MDAVTELLSSPTFQTVALLVGGAVLKWVWDVAAMTLRHRGLSDVELARKALERASKTQDAQDDAIAELALERAMQNKVYYDKLAEALEKAKASLPGGGK